MQFQAKLPEGYAICNCYPNPGNSSTSITFQLPETGHVELKVIDVKGNAVCTLLDGQRSAGIHDIYWNGRNDQGFTVATGMYIFVLNAGGKVFNSKYSLVK